MPISEREGGRGANECQGISNVEVLGITLMLLVSLQLVALLSN